jgi:hypothetical protein
MLSGLPAWATGAAIGGGLGGLAGYGSSMMQDEEDRRPWRSALTGLMAGGALGAGAGLAFPAGKQYLQDRKDSLRLEELDKKMRPGPVQSVLSRFGWPGALGGDAAAAYQAKRNLPEHVGGKGFFQGRLTTLDNLKRMGESDPKIQALVSEFAEASQGDKGAKGLAEGAKKVFERHGGKPGSMTTFRTAGGTPMFRRENAAMRFLGAKPYYMTGTPTSKARGWAGTLGLLAGPTLAKELITSPVSLAELRERRDIINRLQSRQ